ncbi:MAG: hypothetical protein ABFS30_12860, partial [Pseudomonadota bacterium]
LILATAFAITVLILFHDRHWVPEDDGYYAYIAERLVDGAVLHRDVQALHAGYVYIAHAVTLKLFGLDLVSLRYPLAVLTVVQVGLVVLLLLPRGAMAAAAAGLSMTALSYVQFLSPNANWYCLFLLVLVVCALAWRPRDDRWRLEILGFLIVTMFLFRQLNGVFVAIGTLTYLLMEVRSGASGRSRLLGRCLIVVMTAGLAGYLLLKSDPVAWLAFGVWPVAMLVWAYRSVEAPNKDARRILIRFSLGALAALLPLLIYHGVTGSLADWFDDAVIAAFQLSEMRYVKKAAYWAYAYLAMGRIVAPETPAAVLNGVYWLALSLAPAVLGLSVLRRLSRGSGADQALHPLPFLAVFYAVVAVHYQAPAYLYFGVPATIAGLVWMFGDGLSIRRHFMPGAVCVVSAIGLFNHAGQPVAAHFAKIMNGARIAQVPSSGIPRSSLRIDGRHIPDYILMLGIIERQVGADETILTVPGDPQLNFLSGRKAPLRYPVLAYGLRRPNNVDESIKILAQRPPKLVFYAPTWRRNTKYTDRVMAYVKQRYRRLDTPSLRFFEVYRYRAVTGSAYSPRRRQPEARKKLR